MSEKELTALIEIKNSIISWVVKTVLAGIFSLIVICFGFYYSTKATLKEHGHEFIYAREYNTLEFSNIRNDIKNLREDQSGIREDIKEHVRNCTLVK